MANISYDFLDRPKDGGYKNSVGFFSLKNDGDDALVRILHSSVNDFDMLSCHTVEMDGKYRKINCLRDPREDTSKCPLCEANVGKLQQRIFIHLIQYVKDENGNIVALPKIWERSIVFARKLKSLIDEYGNLENRVWKVRRHGAPGKKDTDYDIFPQDSSIYTEQNYPIDKSGFENYSVLGTLVMNKNYDECVSFVRTGSFPQKDKEGVSSASWGTQPKFEQAVPRQAPPVPSSEAGSMPWETGSSNSFQPPRRYN